MLESGAFGRSGGSQYPDCPEDRGGGAVRARDDAVACRGAAAALALTLPTLVRFRAKTDRGILSISGIDLIARPAALVIACLAVVTTAALLLYAAAEQLRPLIS